MFGARSQDSGFLTSVASVRPGSGRTSAGWSPVAACARADLQTRALALACTGASDLRRTRPWKPGRRASTPPPRLPCWPPGRGG